MKKYIYTSLVAVLLACQAIYSQGKVEMIKIDPLNRATIFLNGTISSLNSSLSDDKKTITVKIPKFQPNSMLPTISSSGIINSVSQEVTNDGVTITVKLLERRGYNCVYLRMSNSIMIEVFDWNKLSKDEEKYRDALLALENFQYLYAKRQLQSIKLKDMPNAAGILGILQLQESKLDAAKKSLQIAFDGNSNLPDVYSALAQLAHNSANNKQYAYYINKYASITGKKDFIAITPKEIVDTNSIDKYDSLMFLNSIGAPAPDISDKLRDTTSKQNIARIDSVVNKPQENLIKDKTIFYIAFIFVVIMMMILSTYFRWRKKQIKMLTELSMAATNFKDAEKPQPYREHRTQNQGIAISSKHIENNNHVHPAIQKYMDNKSNKKDTSPKDVSTAKPVSTKEIRQKQKEVINLAEKILETQKVKKEIEAKLEHENTKYKKNPNLDLALSLQKKEQNIKSERISNITADTPKEDLANISSSTIDAKMKMNKLQESKSEIEKLAEKFKGDEEKNTSK